MGVEIRERMRARRRGGRRLGGASLAAATFLFGLAPSEADAKETLTCQLIPRFVRGYLQHHVVYREMNEELESRTIDTYLKRQDASRTLLLEGEVGKMRRSLSGLFDRIQAGNCTSLHELHQQLIKHHRAAEVFVRATVEKPDFEIDRSLSLVLDPEERGRPTTAAERDAINRKLVHFQLSNYLSAGTPLDEATERLVHRYELRAERVADLEPKDLYASFLDALAASLDPHSNYLSAEMLEDFRISMSLSLEGIGVALSERDGYAVAERIIPGGAADRHGVMRPKDKIIAVTQPGGEATNIIDMPLREAVALIRGKKDSDVGLTILRQGEKTERFIITITRDTIDLAEQAAKLRFEERQIGDRMLKLAVLELPSFYGDSGAGKRQCTDDVEKLLAEAREAGAEGLLLDLSRNGGGLLEHAVKISGFFIETGEIVRIENSRGQTQALWDRDSAVQWSGPMVVHTSRVSASASEILAGALKDYGRAVIAGDDHTFGKGTVQTVSSQRDGLGALKITTALFFRPGGRSTQNDGVASDVLVPSLFGREDFGERAQDYALPGQTKPPFLSGSSNAADGGGWKPITAQLAASLADRSEVRVSGSEEFAEVREKLAKARESDGVIALADILKDREETESAAGAGSPDADTAAVSVPDAGAGSDGKVDAEEVADAGEEPNSPQLEEALDVLADLVVALES